jgi:hypothetical protein
MENDSFFCRVFSNNVIIYLQEEKRKTFVLWKIELLFAFTE